MKKFLSLFLAITVIAATLIGALPASASLASVPIMATPLQITETGRGWQYVKALETVMPLGFTTAQGLIVKQNDIYSETYPHESEDGAVASNSRYASLNYSKNIIFGASDGLIIYIKTDAANQIAPYIGLSGASVGSIHPKVGADYQYSAIGETEWYTAQFKTGLTGNDYQGVIDFDAAFNGYVKIPYTSLGNDSNPSFVFNPVTDTVNQIVFRFKGLGQNGLQTSTSTTVYGTATVGPVFVVTKDSSSTKIEVPEEYQTSPIEATPFVGWTSGSASGIACSVITPLGTVNANGILASASTGFDTGDGLSASGKHVLVNLSSSYSLADTEGFIMYVKIDAANQIAFSIAATNTATGDNFGWGNAYVVEGRSFYVLPKGADTWETKTITAGGTNKHVAAMKFDGAFEGYIKIPYASMGSDRNSTYSVFSNAYSITQFAFRFRGLGTVDGGETFGSAVVGPVSTYKTDSPSPVIEYPAEYIPNPIELKPTNSFNSKYNVKNVTAEEAAVSGLLETGIKISSETEYNGSAEDINKAGYVGATFAVTQDLNGTTGVVFYIKTESANSIAPEFGSTGFGYGSAYGKAGAAYYYMPVGGDSWISASFGKGMKNESAYGTVDFKGRFEGYVKIPFSSMFNSKSGYGTFDPERYDFDNVYWRSRYIGGQYGSYTVGPIYLITEDSSSCKFNVIREDIDAQILPEDYYYAPIGETDKDENGENLQDENGKPVFKYISLENMTNGGFKLSSKTDTAVEADDGNIARSNVAGMHINYEEAPLAIGGADGVMIYIDLPSANTLDLSVNLDMPESGWDKAYNPEMGLKPGSFVYALSDGGEWTAMKVQNVNGNADYFGGLVFDGAFKGWIKVPFNHMNNDANWTVKTATDAVQGIALRFKGIGGQYGSVTISKFAFMTKNSLSNVVIETEKVFDKGDINHDGLINAADVTVLRKHLMGIKVNRCCEPNVRGEAEVDIRDLVRLKKLLVG